MKTESPTTRQRTVSSPTEAEESGRTITSVGPSGVSARHVPTISTRLLWTLNPRASNAKAAAEKNGLFNMYKIYRSWRPVSSYQLPAARFQLLGYQRDTRSLMLRIDLRSEYKRHERIRLLNSHFASGSFLAVGSWELAARKRAPDTSRALFFMQ